MSGGRFLVSLREVINSEKILKIKSLLKSDINSWDESVRTEKDANFDFLADELTDRCNELQESTLCSDSREVAIHVAGYISKKLKKKSECNQCRGKLQGDISSDYLDTLSRGGLTKPTEILAEFVCNGFAVLDSAKDLLLTFPHCIRKASLFTLERFQVSNNDFMCESHLELGKNLANKMIVNIFFNNEQKIKNSNLRSDQVTAFKKRQRQKNNV